MAHPSSCTLFNFLQILLAMLLQSQTSQLSHARNYQNSNKVIKSEVFHSPKFVLEPGLVSNKYYYNIDFPRGHIAIKSTISAEIVDETGRSIPLHETYLHHWTIQRYYVPKNINSVRDYHNDLSFRNSSGIIIRNNSGLCDNVLRHEFGVGAETRKTGTSVPDPYGIEVGNPSDMPAGYEEQWVLNVHSIDTRGAEDKLGCTECRCDLFNVTVGEYGQRLPGNYKGGLDCCYDETRCRLIQGFQGAKRILYLRYTVEYVGWEPSIVPVKVYILDVTDVWTKSDEARGVKNRHDCMVEYDIDSCPIGHADSGCIHTKTLTVSLPAGGDLIYGAGHQHAGATAIALYGEGGRVICSSNPIYGQGDEPGNEAGYVVGMSTCYPSPGSAMIFAGETLTIVSNYSNEQSHTGVMGLFYILVADSSEKRKYVLQAPTEVVKIMMISKIVSQIALFGVAFIVVIVFVLKGNRGRGERCEAMI